MLEQLLSKEVADVSAPMPESVEELRKALEEQGKVIEELQQFNGDQRGQLEAKDKIIEDKDKQLGEQEKVIEEKDKIIEDQQRENQGLARRIKELEALASKQ